MSEKKPSSEKTRLHLRNRNRERYDLDALIASNPELRSFVKPNKYGDDSVNFANPAAVKVLNKALLKHYYGIDYWEFPDENLCPPIPGRVDYLHYLADLLSASNADVIPKGSDVHCFDIGVGASCIYPLLGVTEYGWSFMGSEIDPRSIESSQHIIDKNASLQGMIELKLQKEASDIFFGVLDRDQKIDVSMCNPPFHASAESAQQGTRRKVKNLTGKRYTRPAFNFSGARNELVSEGGEHQFIQNMIRESRKFSSNCLWFTTLVSKQSNLKGIYKALKSTDAKEVKTIPMGTGNKSTRIVAWTFFTIEARARWAKERWSK